MIFREEKRTRSFCGQAKKDCNGCREIKAKKPRIGAWPRKDGIEKWKGIKLEEARGRLGVEKQVWIKKPREFLLGEDQRKRN